MRILEQSIHMYVCMYVYIYLCICVYFCLSRNGIYPLTSYAATHRPVIQQRMNSPEMSDSVKGSSPEAFELETRRIINIMCNIKPQEESQNLMVCKN